MIDAEIEVFRADTQASRGITTAMIADLASSYDGANPVPIVIGHPKSDSPAHGEIEGFRADGNKLFAKLKGVGQAIVDGIKDKSILNRSMAFFGPDHEANPTPGKLAPRHLGFLGGSAPGIPGMERLDKSALAFAADGETLEISDEPAAAVVFEPAPTTVFTVHDTKEKPTMDPTAEQIAAAAKVAADAKQLADDRAAFAAEQLEARTTANKSIVDNLVAGGKVLPANAAALTTVFSALDATPLEFTAGEAKKSPASALAAILSAGPKLVDVSGKPITPVGEFNATDTPKTADQITAAVRKLQADDKTLSFEAATAIVTKQEG